MTTLAINRYLRGDVTDGRKLQEEAIVDAADVLGEGHPSTIQALQNLANMAHAFGDPDYARQLEERAARGASNAPRPSEES